MPRQSNSYENRSIVQLSEMRYAMKTIRALRLGKYEVEIAWTSLGETLHVALDLARTNRSLCDA
jgi:cell division inhibitor SulA